MSLARAILLSLAVVLGAPQAVAQDLDIPLPSAGSSKKPKAGKRKTKKPTGKKPVPAASESESELDVPIPTPVPSKSPQASQGIDLDVPIPTPKPPTAKKPDATELDEELIPSVNRTEVVLKLGSSTKGARLYVDNRDLGTLPLSAPLMLDPGEHALLIRKPGFADFSRRIFAQKGRPTEVAVALEAVAGFVTVTSETQGANVSINGQLRGQVPLTGVVLRPGTYEIVVSKEGYEPDKQSVTVKAGKEFAVVATLKPSLVAEAPKDRPQQPQLIPTPPTVTNPQPDPLAQKVPKEVETSQPWFKRWYVWAGVGVVAAAATGAVVATRGSELTPAKVCEGQCDGVINGFRPVGAR